MASLSKWLQLSPLLSISCRLTAHNKLWLSSTLVTTRRNYSNKGEYKNGEKANEATPTQEEGHAPDPYLPPWPNGVNPHTGERGGPRGPEPTRYGDWERKGRVTDF